MSTREDATNPTTRKTRSVSRSTGDGKDCALDSESGKDSAKTLNSSSDGMHLHASKNLLQRSDEL
jgi:hypothetical protein